MKRALKNKTFRAIVVTAFYILLFEAVAMLIGSELIFPGPVLVLKTLFELMLQGEFWASVGLSLLRIVCGYALGVIFGIIIGTLTAFYPVAHTMLRPILSVAKATPVSSFIILVLLWITVGIVPVIIAFIMVAPMVWTAVREGLLATDNQLVEMAGFFGVSRAKQIKYIYFPSVKPLLRASCTTAMGFAWKSGVAAEVLATPQYSIGKLLYESKVYIETDKLFAATLVVIVLSIALEHMLKKLIASKAKAED